MRQRLTVHKCLTTALVLCSLQSKPVYTAILRVPEEYSSIQEAVNAAAQSDTVLLAQGDYRESVIAPARGLTIGSEFLLSGDTTDIEVCVWRGIEQLGDSMRCLTVEDELGPDPAITINGIQFLHGAEGEDEEGGVIRLFRNDAVIVHCRFDSCRAGSGGALAARESHLILRNCRFNYCGASRVAAILYIVNSNVLVDSCLIENNTSYDDIDDRPNLFGMRASNLKVQNSTFRDCGNHHHPAGAHFVYASLPRDTIEIAHCEFHDNRWTNFINWGSEFLNYLRIDSCYFHDELLAGALYSQGLPDCTVTLQVVGNVFARFGHELPYVMHGLFALDATQANVTIQRNLLSEFTAGHTSLGSVYSSSTRQRLITNNYFVSNINTTPTWPPDKQFLFFVNADTGEFEYNIFLNNRGYTIYQAPPWTGASAFHNYFGHETGPFDSVNNTTGQGDTIWWAVDYVPWEPDSDFTSPSMNRPERPEIPHSFIGNAYPNPFNSSVTIEFVLLNDQEIVLDVYDLTGRHVANVITSRMNKGVHIREWKPQTQASGIYFARLSTADGSLSTTKLMYLK